MGDAARNVYIKIRRLRKSLAKWERQYLQDKRAIKNIVLQKITSLKNSEETRELDDEEFKELLEASRDINLIFKREDEI